jgi:hypothetical protein
MTKEKKEEKDEGEGETAASVDVEAKSEDQLAGEDEVPPPPGDEVPYDDQVSTKETRFYALCLSFQATQGTILKPKFYTTGWF